MAGKEHFQEHCTQEQFEDLHQSVDKTRSTSTTVRVNKQALVNLLMDHSDLLKDRGTQYGY
jgi:hypothetical protein